MSIVGYWRFNGNSNDASGNANNGTDTNITYSQSNGIIDGGAGFNNSSSKIVVAPSTSIDISGNITLSAWVRLDGLPASGDLDAVITRKFTNTVGHKVIQFFMDIYNTGTNKILRVGTYSDASYAGTTYIIDSLNLNEFYHFTGIYNGTAWKLYVNGIERASTNGVKPLAQVNNEELEFGAAYVYTAYTRFFNGAIDLITIDNSAWSYSAIKNEYSRVKGFF